MRITEDSALPQPLLDMELTAGRKSASLGDSVELRWDADMPDSLSLVIDNGIDARSMQVGDSGSTWIYIGDCKGKYTFTLKARKHGRDETKAVTVKVTDASKPRKAKVAGVSSFQLWCEKRKAGWITFKNRLVYSWAVLPKKRKRLLIALWILTAILLLWSILSGGHASPSGTVTPETTFV